MTLQPLLVTLSQNQDGKLEYSPICSTLLSELLKIGISSALFFHTEQRSAMQLDVKETLQFAAPAAIYAINNNLVFVILSHVNPTTFQLLSQLKTVFTGLFMRFFLHRKLMVWQYMAIWQLTCGTATSHIPLCISSAGGSDSTSDALGLSLSVVSCILSATGGVYSEKLLKDRAKQSIHWQNIQLYGWGVLFNLLGQSARDPGFLLEMDIHRGFNVWAYAVVVNNALSGLAISALLKYADNIARVYAHAAAMLVTMLASVFLFDQRPTPQLVIAVATVSASAVQYNMPADLMTSGIQASSPPSENKTGPDE